MTTFLFPIERSDQRALIICGVVFSLLPTIAVGLRVLARRMSNRRIDSSDYLIIAACVNIVFYQGLNIASVLVGGAGWQETELIQRFHRPSTTATFIKMMLAQEVLWATSLTLCKLGMLVLYCRIFVANTFILVAKVTSAVIFLWMLSVIIGCFAICQPTAYNWDTSLDGHCGSSVTLWLCTGVLNIVTDLTIILLPMPYLCSLELVLYKRLVLVVTFGLGLFVPIISAIRLYSLVHVDMTDVTYTVTMPVLWSALEPSLAITLACVPLLRPLFGGTYSATGTLRQGNTAKAGPRTPRTQPKRRINKWQDDLSTTELRPETSDWETVEAKEGAHIIVAEGAHAGDDIELGKITVNKGWKVEQGDEGAVDSTLQQEARGE